MAIIPCIRGLGGEGQTLLTLLNPDDPNRTCFKQVPGDWGDFRYQETGNVFFHGGMKQGSLTILFAHPP